MLPEFLRGNMGVAIVALVVFVALAALRPLLFGREGMDDGNGENSAQADATGAQTQADTDADAAQTDTDPDEPKPTESAKDPNGSFCKVDQSLAEREQACLALDKDSCGLAGCCVWATATAGDKTQQLCVAGNASGPTFLSEPGSSSLYNVTGYDHGGKTYLQKTPAKSGQGGQGSQGDQTESVWQELTGPNVQTATE
jgi:hypothetical protein